MTLTRQQTERVALYRERWQRFVLCTEPVDRLAAEAAIRKLYRTLSSVEPRYFLWFESPLEAAEAALILQIERDPEFFVLYWGQLKQAQREMWERVRGLIVQETHVQEWGRVLPLIANPEGVAWDRRFFGAIRVDGPWLPSGPRYLRFIRRKKLTEGLMEI